VIFIPISPHDKIAEVLSTEINIFPRSACRPTWRHVWNPVTSNCRLIKSTEHSRNSKVLTKFLLIDYFQTPARQFTGQSKSEHHFEQSKSFVSEKVFLFSFRNFNMNTSKGPFVKYVTLLGGWRQKWLEIRDVFYYLPQTFIEVLARLFLCHIFEVFTSLNLVLILWRLQCFLLIFFSIKRKKNAAKYPQYKHHLTNSDLTLVATGNFPELMTSPLILWIAVIECLMFALANSFISYSKTQSKVLIDMISKWKSDTRRKSWLPIGEKYPGSGYVSSVRDFEPIRRMDKS